MGDGMNISTVNELIQSLESAGELSIKETKVMALAKAFKQLAEENVVLKAGASYFSYGSEHNFEWHKTAEEAVEAAEAAIDDYRGDACDGWSEEVDSICWGIIMQSSTKVGERPRNEDDRCDPAIDTVCDYALLPNIETPATDRIVAGIKADGVEEFSADLGAVYQQLRQGSAQAKTIKSVIFRAAAFSAALREEADK
ncbi:hypothetical protein CWN49_09315 [Klebsiella michiganensis]|uniref:Uncharacterized protein n=1 Tax=Klebsiella michiganensis TaxID=1134687 RepID=A0A2J5Q077_9ENTR|nr:hypothetical protein CWN49_09315 [Klebsiella michiganensis]